MKKHIKAIAKVLLFVFLFAMIYTYSRDVLRNKSESEALGIIVKEPDGMYDVILAGPSHMQYAMQPAQLFGEFGIAACNTATSAQSIPTSYYIIKEMIDRHDPELVVLDLFCLFYPDNYFTPTRMHQAIDNFPLSKNKAEAITDLVKDDKSEFFLNYLLYHSRWKELQRFDYTAHKEHNEKYKLLFECQPFDEPFIPTYEKSDIPEIPLKYLNKLVALCKETDTELLLTVIPYRADIDNNNTSAVLQQQMYNTVEELAKEWGVGYINGLHHLKEMNFDFSTDMFEDSHVNVFGSNKVTNYYGKYIIDNYDIQDRYKEEKYSDWHDDFAEYTQLLEKSGIE